MLSLDHAASVKKSEDNPSPTQLHQLVLIKASSTLANVNDPVANGGGHATPDLLYQHETYIVLHSMHQPTI
jgi:hypothetical protein